MNDLLQFSALSRLNTGNMVVDFLAVLVIGVALEIIQQFDVAEALRRLVRFDVVRVVQHTRHLGFPAWSNVNNEEVINHVLIHAIVYYINRGIPVSFRDSEVLMMQLPHCDAGFDTTDIMFVPGRWAWTPLCSLHGCNVSIMRAVDESSSNSPPPGGSSITPVRTVTDKYMIRASGSGDKDRAIEEFISRAHAAYKGYVKARLNKDARFYYACVRHRDEDGVDAAVFKRYNLVSTKKLEHVAHPAIPHIKKTLADLMSSSGKFAVDGHAKKATFLLHGPPGTGKTSLIKAIASFTNRHIVSVNLANVQTSQEFMDIMFSEKIGAYGSDVWVRNEDAVFVMEDVDAACDIVKDRGAAPPAVSGPAKSDKSDKSHKEPFVPNRDPLTLATLLNVLDGALECEKRIVIMTTNYVERLDRALVRPGRITVNVEMGYIRSEQAIEIIDRYFPGDVTPLLRADLDALLEEKNVTPAEVEMACSYCDTAQTIISALGDCGAGGSANSSLLAADSASNTV